ncbi:MAG: class I SAM-dependent methyltransferase [Parachlamydiaceae bacterium]|nr:class I SAM-dependent methyltransferase [Parachlamydiaceae bacterium]
MKTISQFFLFQSHLDLAHAYWKKSLEKGDIAIDATCGNGYDTLELAHLIFDKKKQQTGQLAALDRQMDAIEATRARLKEVFAEDVMQYIHLSKQCHSSFPDYFEMESVALIVYNLGYLPGGNKSLTTMSSTTIQSLEAALPLITPGGCISITCYPGHEEGKNEENMIKKFAAALSPRQWSSCHHTWLNRNQAPSLLILQKAQK